MLDAQTFALTRTSILITTAVMKCSKKLTGKLFLGCWSTNVS